MNRAFRNHLLSVKSTRALFLLVMIGLVSCTNLGDSLQIPTGNRIKTIQISTTENANQSTAVAVDIVYLFEERLATTLSKYTARQWFSERAAYQLQHPNDLTVFNYELVPNSTVTLQPSKEKNRFPMSHQKAVSVLVFANYLTEKSDYTLNITAFVNPEVILGQRKMTVVDEK